jgi:hypothetical protein
MIFTCLVKNSDASLIWAVPFSNFLVSQELNKGESLSITFERVTVQPVADAHGVTPEYIFSASYREIEIYDENDSKIYAGYISEVQFSKGNSDTGKITISSKGFFSLLEKRFCDDSLAYTDTDSADIAWALITYTQALSYGDFGITRGSHPVTKNRDRNDLRYKNIAEAIRKMSANEVKEGFDFDVSPLKVFNIYYPKGSTRANIFLQDGFNIDGYTIYKTFIDGMVNQVIEIGSGVDEANQLIVTRDADNAYKEAFFLLQDIQSEPDVSTEGTLEDKGDLYIETYQSPRITIVADCRYDDPLWTDYEVGDWLNLEIESYDIDDSYRVYRRSVDERGTVSLTLREY